MYGAVVVISVACRGAKPVHLCPVGKITGWTSRCIHSPLHRKLSDHGRNATHPDDGTASQWMHSEKPADTQGACELPMGVRQSAPRTARQLRSTRDRQLPWCAMRASTQLSILLEASAGVHGQPSRCPLSPLPQPTAVFWPADQCWQGQATTARSPVKLIQQGVLWQNSKNGNPHPGRARPLSAYSAEQEFSWLSFDCRI